MDPRKLRQRTNPYDMPSDHDQHEQQDEIDETTAYDGFQYEPGYGEAGRLGPFDPTAAPGQYEYQPNTGMGLQQGSNTHAWGQQHGGIASSSFHQPPLGQQFPPEFGPGSLQYAVPPFSNPYVGGQPHPNVPTLPQVPSQRSGTPGPSRLDQMLPIMPGQLMENSPGGEQCPMCPARFDRPTRLQGHINAHQGIRPHICGGECGDTQCTSSFFSAEALTSHRSNKTRTRCEKCNNLVAKKNMSRHLKEHCSSLY